MKLLDQVVDLLSDKSGSLTDALLKTKVLMHQIGHQELAEWVNDELNGYANGKPVPKYRIVRARVVGNIQTHAYIQSNQPLLTGHLPEALMKSLHESELRQSISVLEEFASAPGKHLAIALSPEYYNALSEAYEGAWVQKAWIQMEPTQVLHGLTEVRSRLLDFVLVLQDKLGDLEGAEMKVAAKSIDAPAMFQHAVFGDNTTIVMGDNNSTTIKNVVKKGDFASLASALKGRGVADEDVSALQTAIGQDSGAVDVVKKQFGPAVRQWMTKMLGKAIDTSWQLEVGVAGGLLTEALRAYYF